MTPERVALGKIGRAHGVRGEFRVWPYADDLERFAHLKRVTMSRGNKSIVATVEAVRIAEGFVVMLTDAVHTPEEVQIWLGGDIEIESDERIAPPAGQYFHDQIVGLRVETTGGEFMGTIVRIIENPANDIYVCQQDDKEYLIPAVEAFVKAIDLAAGRIVVAPIPGMFE